MSTMALAHIPQCETSLVNKINPAITVLELRDFSHVSTVTHLALRDHIYIIFESTLPTTVYLSTEGRDSVYSPPEIGKQNTIKT